jgi:transcriptional regulator with XRE-family HTH domain
MAVLESPQGFSEQLRWWRTYRRFSQLDLAGLAGVSAKHLSYLETGRSTPSPEMVLHLARHLDVPAREQNALLLAAGYAPRYPERSLDDDAMADVRRVVDLQLRHHEPYPAICVDRRWDLLAANDAAWAFVDGVAPELAEPPINVMRLSLHPEGPHPGSGTSPSTPPTCSPSSKPRPPAPPTGASPNSSTRSPPIPR